MMRQTNVTLASVMAYTGQDEARTRTLLETLVEVTESEYFRRLQQEAQTLRERALARRSERDQAGLS